MNCPFPGVLEPIDPMQRAFPVSWRDAASWELYDRTIGGVRCPMCAAVFSSRRELRQLQADHIIPYSRGGRTTWENLQLLCKPCNLMKGNKR